MTIIATDDENADIPHDNDLATENRNSAFINLTLDIYAKCSH